MDYRFYIFVAAWLVVLACGIAILHKRKLIHFSFVPAALSMVFMAMMGPVGELLVGSLYQGLFGQMLWRYEVLPIHHGYTSLIAPIIWALGGLEFWLATQLLSGRKLGLRWKYGLLMVDTLFYEMLLNLSFLLVSGGLLFYYIPGDLWHVSSLQTLPFYLVLAVTASRANRYMAAHPRFFMVLCTMVVIALVYVAT